MKDLTIIEEAFKNNTIKSEALANSNLERIIKPYSNKENNLIQLKIINNKNKLSCSDVYEIITSKYPEYMSQLIIESKVIESLQNSQNLTKIIEIINNCNQEYQAFGIIFIITQVRKINIDNLIKISKILSNIKSVNKMYYSLKISLIINNVIDTKKMIELIKIIANSKNDNNARYAYKISKEYINKYKNPIWPAYKASKASNIKTNNVKSKTKARIIN